jgi:hypothetical protein
MAKQDDLDEGRRMIGALMKSADNFEDKLKAFDRWVKFQELVRRQAAGAMGKGFEDLSDVIGNDL